MKERGIDPTDRRLVVSLSILHFNLSAVTDALSIYDRYGLPPVGDPTTQRGPS